MTARPLSLALLAFAAACGSGRIVPADTPQPAAESSTPAAEPAPAPASGTSAYLPYDGGSLPLRRIGQWSTSGIATPTRVVIRDDTSYAKLWAAVGAGTRPSVDFTHDLVIAVAAGQQTSGGHGIMVQRVTRAGQGLAVDVVETSPGPGCAAPQMLTQPVDVVVVAAADAQTWSFSEQKVAQGCQ